MKYAKITLKKWGNSQGIVIPKQIRQELDVNVGSVFMVTVNNGSIILKPQSRTNNFKIPKNFKIQKKNIDK